MTVAVTAPLTTLVEIENVAVVEPAATTTLDGTVTLSPPDNTMAAPPDGAGAVSVAVPITVPPPITLDLLSEIEDSAADADTVSIGDWLLLPLNDAVNVAVPGVNAAMVNVELDKPAGITTDPCTVATRALLLDNEIVEPPRDGAASVTVPCPPAPGMRLDTVNATPDRLDVFVAAVGEPAQPARAIDATSMVASETKRAAHVLKFM